MTSWKTGLKNGPHDSFWQVPIWQIVMEVIQLAYISSWNQLSNL
jgi:hypothetical protein